MTTTPARSSNPLFQQQVTEFTELLGRGKTVLVSSHKSPDGDALASILAAAQILNLLGSEAVCALEGMMSARFSFLPGADKLRNVSDLPPGSFNTVLTLDCGSLSRIGSVAERIGSDPIVVNIDHHPDNGLFGRLNIVYPEASSTSELLFDLVRALDLPLDASLATLMYAGLMTDTGSFRHTNTTPEGFLMASQLCAAGADSARIAEAVYSTNSLGSLKLLGEAMNSLELNFEGRVAIMTVQQPDTYEELEEITDFALSVKGVRTLALFRVSKNATRVSLRARGSHDVAHIARKHGGGGHEKAAGFTYNGPISEIRGLVLEELHAEVVKNLPVSRDKDGMTG
jgi:phosphoesterase RecJ-like protein